MTQSLSTFAYGPVELDVISLESPTPSPALLQALARQIEAGVVRLLDFVVVSKNEAGDEVTIEEVDLAEFGLANLDVVTPGLAAEEDLFVLATELPPGGAAAIVALELTWARELAEQLAADNSFIVATERIPATVVNAVAGLAAEIEAELEAEAEA